MTEELKLIRREGGFCVHTVAEDDHVGAVQSTSDGSHIIEMVENYNGRLPISAVCTLHTSDEDALLERCQEMFDSSEKTLRDEYNRDDPRLGKNGGSAGDDGSSGGQGGMPGIDLGDGIRAVNLGALPGGDSIAQVLEAMGTPEALARVRAEPGVVVKPEDVSHEIKIGGSVPIDTEKLRRYFSHQLNELSALASTLSVRGTYVFLLVQQLAFIAITSRENEEDRALVQTCHELLDKIVADIDEKMRLAEEARKGVHEKIREALLNAIMGKKG